MSESGSAGLGACHGRGSPEGAIGQNLTPSIRPANNVSHGTAHIQPLVRRRTGYRSCGLQQEAGCEGRTYRPARRWPLWCDRRLSGSPGEFAVRVTRPMDDAWWIDHRLGALLRILDTSGVVGTCSVATDSVGWTVRSRKAGATTTS